MQHSSLDRCRSRSAGGREDSKQPAVPPGIREVLAFIDRTVARRGRIDVAAIADRSGVTFAAASRLLAALHRARLVRMSPHRAYFLSPQGRSALEIL